MEPPSLKKKDAVYKNLLEACARKRFVQVNHGLKNYRVRKACAPSGNNPFAPCWTESYVHVF